MFANLKMYSPDVLTDSVEALDSNLRCYRYSKTKTLEHARGAAMDAAAALARPLDTTLLELVKRFA